MVLQAGLPQNLVCLVPPDGSLTFAAALTDARSAYHRLYPEEVVIRGGELPRALGMSLQLWFHVALSATYGQFATSDGLPSLQL